MSDTRGAEFEHLLESLRRALRHTPVDVNACREVVRDILNRLMRSSAETDRACHDVNDFVLLKILCSDTLRKKLDCLPREVREVILDMGSCLHDTHSAPDIAQSFAATPEMLLDRLLKDGSENQT